MFTTVALHLLLACSTAAEISTNASRHSNAPPWASRARIERVEDKIGRSLEWDIRRIQVTWYTDEGSFARVHQFGTFEGGPSAQAVASVAAVTRRADQSVHLGPRVNATNFDRIYGHELVHVILAQKYKQAIPGWLEEGLANYTAQHEAPDLGWLAQQPPRAIRSLGHPFKEANPKYHYAASTAAMQFIASRCDVRDLLQLSVGKKLESYLQTTCGIPDLDAAFSQWLKAKSRPRP